MSANGAVTRVTRSANNASENNLQDQDLHDPELHDPPEDEQVSEDEHQAPTQPQTQPQAPNQTLPHVANVDSDDIFQKCIYAGFGYYAIESTSVLIESLPFLHFQKISPLFHKVSRHALESAMLAVCTLDDDERILEASTFVSYLTFHKINEIAAVLVQICETDVFHSIEDLHSAVAKHKSILPIIIHHMDITNYQIWWMEKNPELDYLNDLSWSCYVSERFGLLGLAKISNILGGCKLNESGEERAIDSQIKKRISVLRVAIFSILKQDNTPNNNALVTSQLPALINSYSMTLPPNMRSEKFTPDSTIQDILDASRYRSGNTTIKFEIEARRLHTILADEPTILKIMDHFQIQDKITGLEQLAAALFHPTNNNTEKDLLITKMLQTIRPICKDMLLSINALMHEEDITFDMFLQKLQNERQHSQPNKDDVLISTDGRSLSKEDAAIEPPMLREVAFRAAVNTTQFQSFITNGKDKSGLSLIEAAVESKAVLCTVQMFTISQALANKHHMLGQLLSHMNVRILFVAMRLGKSMPGVDSLINTYTWSKKQELLFFKCKWHQIDLINSKEGGYLKLRELMNGCTVQHVPTSEQYTLYTTLLEVREFGNELFKIAGYSTKVTAEEGFSFASACDKQLEFVRRAADVPMETRKAWLAGADDAFRSALQRAGQAHEYKMKSTEPATINIHELIPADDPWVKYISDKLQDATILACTRRALPHLDSTKITHVLGSESYITNNYQQSNQPSNPNRPTNHPPPGSKYKTLITEMGNGKFKLGSQTVDAGAAASKCGIELGSKCWPVLFSRRPGEGKLAVCPDPKKHGGLSSAMHTPPDGFDIDYFEKEFVQRPQKGAGQNMKRKRGFGRGEHKPE